jgi:hypothetical protein
MNDPIPLVFRNYGLHSEHISSTQALPGESLQSHMAMYLIHQDALTQQTISSSLDKNCKIRFLNRSS